MRKKFRFLGALCALSVSLIALSPLTTNAYVEKKKNDNGSYTYTNTDTGETITCQRDFDDGTNNYLKNEMSVNVINKGSYKNTIKVATTIDVAGFANFRSDKKGLEIKILDHSKSNAATWSYLCYSRMATDLANNSYYKDRFGNKVKVSKETEAKIRETNKNLAQESYELRLYTKKTGKFKLLFDELDHDGKVISTKSINILSKDDADPIKEITFAGKRFYESSAREAKGIHTNLYDAPRFTYTTKKAGKLKVKMNKGYIVKKIEIGYDTIQRHSGSTDDNTHDADEKFTWKTVKNGSKIKMGKLNSTSADVNKRVRNDNAPGGYEEYKKIWRSDPAITYIRVTYYDVKNRTTKIYGGDRNKFIIVRR